MLIYRHLDGKKRPEAVAAIGNFDGVHHGHRALIQAAIDQAVRLGMSPAVMTFEPHPRTLFHPDTPPFRLTPFRTKAQILKSCGVKVLYVIPFNNPFSKQSADDFLKNIIHRGNIKHIVVGEDFVFGHKREGNVDFLRQKAETYGFGITTMPPVCGPNGRVYSATWARHCLHHGEPEGATSVLGRPWSIEGRVQKGDQRGRQIGVPTANIALKDYLRPASGVYGVRVKIPAGQSFPGVANIGKRPTVGGTDERLEVHILDQNMDLYGQRLCVDLLTFFRPEIKFVSFQELTDQIQKDIQSARQFFAAKDSDAHL